MRRRTLAAWTLAGVMSAATAARAGCCDDFWSCAAAVATGGLSCQIQAIVDTVKTLSQVVVNLLNDLTSKTAEIVNDARNAVTQAAADVGQIGNQAASELATTANRAHAIAYPSPMAVAPARGPGVTGPGVAIQEAPLRTAGPPAPPTLGGGGVARAPEALAKPADPATVKSALQRADAYVQDLKSKQDGMGRQVTAAGNSALNALSRHVQVAQQIAVDAALEPLKLLRDSLTDLLAHPERIFDPTAQIDADVTRISNEVTAMLDRMTTEITTEANAQLEASRGIVQQMQDHAAAGSSIADSMQRLAHSRSQPDLDALAHLVPNLVPSPTAAPGPRDLSAVVVPVGIMGRHDLVVAALARSQPQNLTVVMRHKATVADIATKWAGIKAQAKVAARVDPAHAQRVDQELSVKFRGKPPAEVQRQKQLLIEEAKKRFAGDPKTLQKLLQYIESHAQA
jgi:hypothetical protein